MEQVRRRRSEILTQGLDELRNRARRRGMARALNVGFHALSLAGRLHPKAKPERHGVERIRDISYRPDSGRRAHLLDVYRPLPGTRAGQRLDQGPLPVVFYVHGGGFQALSKDTHWLMALAFARRGYLVVNISYRLAPRNPFPAPLVDVCDAFAFALKKIPEWGGDLKRLSLAGESAGANLVSALAITACYERPESWARRVFDAVGTHGGRPRAVLASCGMHQVSDAARFRRRKPDMPKYLAWVLEDVEDCYLPGNGAEAPGRGDSNPVTGPRALANPLSLFEHGEPPDRPLPAFQLTVGTADPLIDDTRRMAAALDNLGVRNEALYFHGQPHAFHAIIALPAARRCWREMYAFLEEHV